MVGLDDPPVTPWERRHSALIGGRDVRLLLMRWRGSEGDEAPSYGVATYDQLRPSIDCREVSASAFRRYMP